MARQAWSWLFVQLEGMRCLHGALSCHDGDTHSVSQGGQPARETLVPVNPDQFYKQWQREGTRFAVLLPWSVLHLIKGEDEGTGLPENTDGRESPCLNSLNSISPFEVGAALGLVLVFGMHSQT